MSTALLIVSLMELSAFSFLFFFTMLHIELEHRTCKIDQLVSARAQEMVVSTTYWVTCLPVLSWGVLELRSIQIWRWPRHKDSLPICYWQPPFPLCCPTSPSWSLSSPSGQLLPPQPTWRWQIWRLPQTCLPEGQERILRILTLDDPNTSLTGIDKSTS